MTWMKNNRDDTKNTNANLGCADNNHSDEREAIGAILSKLSSDSCTSTRCENGYCDWTICERDIQILSKQLRKNGGNAANRSNRRDDY